VSKSARQTAILQILARHDALTTTHLAQLLAVSQETLRRDLTALQAQGKIVRHHGRARAIHADNVDAGLDASSTCFHLARKLPDLPLTVFTNSQPICQEMARRQHVTLLCAGGELDRKYRCYKTPALASLLKSVDIDLFIFSCEGVDANGDMWDPTAHNAGFKTQLLKRAQQSLLLIDKSKFRRASEVKIGHLSAVTQMISDAPRYPIAN